MNAEMLTDAQQLNAMALKSFFEHAKLSIQSQSQQGKLPKDVIVKAGLYRGEGGAQFATVPRLLGINNLREASQIAYLLRSGNHWSSPLWQQFVAWAASEGLGVTWRWQHDGVGESDWFELSVQLLD